MNIQVLDLKDKFLVIKSDVLNINYLDTKTIDEIMKAGCLGILVSDSQFELSTFEIEAMEKILQEAKDKIAKTKQD